MKTVLVVFCFRDSLLFGECGSISEVIRKGDSLQVCRGKTYEKIFGGIYVYNLAVSVLDGVQQAE